MSKNEYMKKHGERKEKILALLDDASRYIAAQEKREDAQALQKLRENIAEGLFSIVLVGEFSAGKSTFLNALMHKYMLPSFSKETTATVNFLRHASKAPNGEKGIVYYRDGSKEVLPDLDVKTIERFATTNGGTDDKAVAVTTEKIDLFLDSPFLEDGVMLVDSPGLNGITENLEEVTRRQIKESHASIFMFSTDHPGSRTDFEILRDLRKQCNRIFIVLNKIDDIKANEGETPESIVEHLKESYTKLFPEVPLPEIYPIAAYRALAARDETVPDTKEPHAVKDEAFCRKLEEESRLSVFENRLCRYLAEGEKTREEFSAPLHTAMALLKDVHEDVKAQLAVLAEETSKEDLLEKKAAFEKEIQELQEKQQASWKPVEERFQRLMRDFKDKAYEQCSRIRERIEEDIEEIDAVKEMREYAEGLQERLEGRYKSLFHKLDDDLRDELKLVVEEESEDSLDKLQEAFNKVGAAGLNISIREIKLTDVEVGKNMEAVDRAFEETQEKIEQIRLDLEQCEIKRAKARRLEKERELLQQDLRDLAARRIHIEDTFMIPGRERYMEEVIEEEGRGLLGFLFGKKKVPRMKIRFDTAARDNAMEEKANKLSAIEEQERRIRMEMERYRGEITTSEEFDLVVRHRQQNLDELREKYRKDMEKHLESLEKDAERALKRLKRDTQLYLEEFTEENSQVITASLKAVERGSFAAVKEMIAARIRAEIERKEEIRNRLLADCEASEVQRAEKLERMKESETQVTDLLARCVDMQAEIEEGMTDSIGEA